MNIKIISRKTSGHHMTPPIWALIVTSPPSLAAGANLPAAGKTHHFLGNLQQWISNGPTAKPLRGFMRFLVACEGCS